MDNYVEKSNVTKKCGGELIDESGYLWLEGWDLEGINGRYHIDKLFKVGGEAVLFTCFKDNSKYIAKIYKSIPLNRTKRNKFVDILYNQKSDYIVPLLDYGISGEIMFDIYPFFDNGNIYNKKISLEYIKDVFIPNMNEALRVIHSYGVTHRDVKPENIMYSNDMKKVLLHDFSIMSIVDFVEGNGRTETPAYTLGYAAPEVLQNIIHIKSDYYSLGIALLSLLNDGMDIYGEFDDATRMKCTVLRQIPTLKKGKFDKSNVNQLSLREKIELLAEGLTITDTNDRWGYEEVDKWCKGEMILPTTRDVDGEFDVPFEWNGKKRYSCKEFVEGIVEDWEKGKKEALRGTFAAWFRLHKPDISSKLYDMMEVYEWKTEPEKDVCLFRNLYIIDPYAEKIYWKDNAYDSFGSWTKDLLENNVFDESIVELLKTKTITWYINNKKNLSEIPDYIKKNIDIIENYAKIKPMESYYEFLLLFSSVKDRFFRIDNKSIYSVEQLCEEFFFDKQYSGDFYKKNLLFNEMFYSWMWIKGLSSKLDAAKKDINGSTTDKECLRRVFVMIDSLVDDKTKIRECFLKRNEFMHILWLKSNLDKYVYKTDFAHDLKKNLEECKLDTIFNIDELYNKFEIMNEQYKTFVSNTESNVYGITYGVSDNKAIYPIYASTAFLYKHNDNMITSQCLSSVRNLDGITTNHAEMKAIARKRVDEINRDVAVIYDKSDKLYDKYYKKYYTFIPLKMVFCVAAIVGLLILSFSVDGVYKFSMFLAGIFPAISLLFELKNQKNHSDLLVKWYSIRKNNDEVKSWNTSIDESELEINTYFQKKDKDVELEMHDVDKFSNIIKDSNRYINEMKNGHTNGLRTLRKVAYVLSGIGAGLLIFNFFSINVIPKVAESINVSYASDITIVANLLAACGIIVALIFNYNKVNIESYFNYISLICWPLMGVLAVIVLVGAIMLVAILLFGVLQFLFYLIIFIAIICAIGVFIYIILSGS